MGMSMSAANACHVQFVIGEIDMSEQPPPLQPSLTVDGIAVNVPSLPEAVSSIVSAAQHGENFSVCTLNLDHVVQLQQHANFRAAYRRARFVTADGFPIVVLSNEGETAGEPAASDEAGTSGEDLHRHSGLIRRIPASSIEHGTGRAPLAARHGRSQSVYLVDEQGAFCHLRVYAYATH